jgi:hypothetical protein
VSNVVFMGMGEPLLNLPSVLRAHEILNKEIGIGEWAHRPVGLRSGRRQRQQQGLAGGQTGRLGAVFSGRGGSCTAGHLAHHMSQLPT